MSGDERLDLLLATGPFHAALRRAIRERGLSLERLRSHLAQRGIHIGVSSLSFWQHGHTVPTRRGSVRAVRALEEILQLPPDSLLTLLAAAQAGNSGPACRCGTNDRTDMVGDRFDLLPGPSSDDVDVVSRHERVLLSADGHLTSLWVRTVVQARTDGVGRYIMRWYGRDHGVDGIRIRPLANFRLGQVRRHPTAPILVAELLFDEFLLAGQTWVFEFELTDANGGRLHEFAHGFNYPVGHYLVEIRFHPAAPPVDCHVYARAGLYAEYRRVKPLTLNRHHTVHHMASNLTAGVLGIAWAWPDAADHGLDVGWREGRRPALAVPPGGR
jgi:hypothetical protein